MRGQHTADPGAEVSRKVPGTTISRRRDSCPSRCAKGAVAVTTIQFFGQDADGLYRGGVVDGRVPADVAEELFRLGWQTATLLREHHQVVGWLRPDPDRDECTWYGEPTNGTAARNVTADDD